LFEPPNITAAVLINIPHLLQPYFKQEMTWQDLHLAAAAVLSCGHSANYLITPHSYVQTFPQHFIFKHL
jgi:hypothetical protein